MGFSSSWIAVRGKSSEDVLAELSLVETSLMEWMPESEVVSSSLPTGWFLIFFNNVSPQALKPEALKSLSSNAEVITCQIEEHAMVSTASEWRNGIETWYVSHDAEDGLTNLETIGSPPSALSEIFDRQEEKQQQEGGVDYIFDVPIDLVASLVGFRHDSAFDEAPSETFTVLAPKR